jgi:hypothetical protein
MQIMSHIVPPFLLKMNALGFIHKLYRPAIRNKKSRSTFLENNIKDMMSLLVSRNRCFKLRHIVCQLDIQFMSGSASSLVKTLVCIVG